MEWRFWARTRPAQFDASEYVSENDCDAIDPLLSLYGDGMASAHEARLVEAHLPGCESCRETLAWMQATRRALSGRPVQSPPFDLHARIAEAIAVSEAAPLRLRPARAFVTRPAFAAAASLATVGLFLGYSLTHLPRPAAPSKPASAVNVAIVPSTVPSVSVAPEKPAAPTVTKNKPGPLIADNKIGTDDISPSVHVTPETASTPRLVSPPVRPDSKAAVKTALPVAVPATTPRLKPIMPRPTRQLAVKLPATVKHAPAPLPTKAPLLVASTNVKTKEPDVVVLPSKVTPQEPPASVQVATVPAGQPRVQTVDFVSELRAHVPSPTKINRTVGLSLRGAVAATHTFDSGTGATRVANMVGIAH